MEMGLSYHQIEKETSTYDKCHQNEFFHNTVQYMYGIHIPHDTTEALKLDEEMGMIIGRK